MYDFIVIGGGSAGAVIANRLSEIPDWKVLLLEAGGDENEVTDVPALTGYLQLSEFDWMYQTAPPTSSAYCLAMIGDRCNWPRGKVLGGSSVLNAMIYVRGNRYNTYSLIRSVRVCVRARVTRSGLDKRFEEQEVESETRVPKAGIIIQLCN